MGIFISLKIADTITAEEWERAYQKSVTLMEKMPFIDKKAKEYYGAELICATKTVEEELFGEMGWCAMGDGETMKTAEEFFLPKDILSAEQASTSTKPYVDPYMSILPTHDILSFEDERCSRVLRLWGNKTQGEPYHFYLLAIACMLEQELPGKVAIHGDITKGQCRKAVQIVSDLLGEKVELPDRCDLQRLHDRVREMPLQENEIVDAFTALYMGNQENEFGVFLQEHFSDEELAGFWERYFEKFPVNHHVFSSYLKKYLLWGFPLAGLKKYVRLEDKEGNSLTEKFVTAVLDTEIFIEEKDCEDLLEIDNELENTYGVSTLMAHFLFAGAKNRRVNRYIPLEELSADLSECVGDRCDVSQIIAAYMAEREKQEQEAPSDMFKNVMQKTYDEVMSSREKYDITEAENLLWFEKGDTIEDKLQKWIMKSFTFCRTLPKEAEYKHLVEKGPTKVIRFLIEENRMFLFKEESWQKIFNDIERDITTFERYYPLVRIDSSAANVIYQFIQALALNDEFYQYCMEQTNS